MKFRNGGHENLVEHLCCPKVTHNDLKFEVSSGFKISKLIPWKCFWNDYGSCGADNKLMIIKCGVLANNEHMIDVMDRVDAPRQVLKKNGKQNTQLEPGVSKLSVEDSIVKLAKLLETNHYIKHNTSGEIR